MDWIIGQIAIGAVIDALNFAAECDAVLCLLK